MEGKRLPIPGLWNSFWSKKLQLEQTRNSMDHRDQDEFLYVYGENYVIRGLGDDEVKSALGEKIFWRRMDQR